MEIGNTMVIVGEGKDKDMKEGIKVINGNGKMK